jgi:LPS O-antigen subunit length determinant protein (WzzB/FepE family)
MGDELTDEVKVARQTWFWRRTTLQVTLFFLAVALVLTLLLSGMRSGDWPTAAIQVAIVAAIAWLNTMYFAMVDNADKVANVIREAVDAIDASRSSG